MVQERTPWGDVPPTHDDPAVRERIRRLRDASGQLLAVLDDDPTGSQSVHNMDVVFALEPSEYAQAFEHSSSCFVLTNSRSLPRNLAAKVTGMVARDLFDLAVELGRPLQLVSRSDSTLRGHVMTEIETLVDVSEQRGCVIDAVLIVPAFLEAGRVTADDVHWARVNGQFVPVAETEFAHDPTFRYTSSDLRQFLAEVSGGRTAADSVVSIGLAAIRRGGPEHVVRLIAAARRRAFIVVNALDYADLECVALASLLAQEEGQSLLFRTGPSMVRALDGQDGTSGVSPAQIWKGGRPVGNGLVVVGSHVGHTNRQVAALLRAADMTVVTIDVPDLLGLDTSARAAYVSARASDVANGLRAGDVLLMTSRSLVTGTDREESLRVAQTVSAVLADVVRLSLDVPPAWVVAKGGITSHDVAVRGLGLRRATVEGQFFEGMISLLHTTHADPRIADRPYVVFAGNVGGDTALAAVVARIKSAS